LTEALANIRRLRALAARLVAGELGDDGRWLGLALRLYAETAGAVTIEGALGLRPGPGQESWATIERRARRDEAIRALAREHFARPSLAATACDVAAAIRDYARRCWSRDRGLDRVPASYLGKPEEHLFAAFKVGLRVPESAKQIHSILIGEDEAATEMKGGIFISETPADDHLETAERELR